MTSTSPRGRSTTRQGASTGFVLLPMARLRSVGVTSKRPKRRWVAGPLVACAGVALAAVFVRVSLAWSDAQPYEGSVTEARYIVFICITLAILAGSAIAGFILWRGPRGR